MTDNGVIIFQGSNDPNDLGPAIYVGSHGESHTIRRVVRLMDSKRILNVADATAGFVIEFAKLFPDIRIQLESFPPDDDEDNLRALDNGGNGVYVVRVYGGTTAIDRYPSRRKNREPFKPTPEDDRAAREVLTRATFQRANPSPVIAQTGSAMIIFDSFDFQGRKTNARADS